MQNYGFLVIASDYFQFHSFLLFPEVAESWSLQNNGR